MTSLKIIFENKWVRIALLLIVVQQVLVATGTYLMGAIANDAAASNISLYRVLLLLFCLTISGSLFHYLISLSMVKGERGVLLGYLSAYIKNNYNHPQDWRNADEKKQRHQIMCREGQGSLETTVYFVVDVFTVILNITLNTMAVAVVTNATLGLVTLAAGLVGLLIVHASSEPISKSSEKEIHTQNQLNDFLSRSWDNIILGNKEIYEYWREKFHQVYTQAREGALGAAQSRELSVSLASFFTTGAVVSTCLFLAWSSRNAIGEAVALLIMLPRSLQIVMHIQLIQSHWARWKYLRQRLIVTDKSLVPNPNSDLERYIEYDSISIAKDDLKISARQFLNTLTKTDSGRYVIRGTNGSGKTSLLLLLKKELGEKALFIPTHHTFEVQGSANGKSSGEIAAMSFAWSQRSEAKYFLFDEWDANLSRDNQELLNSQIDELSKSHVVIEVRHRNEV